METKEVFGSVTDGAEKLNCKTVETIARVCRGERPTFQGFHYAFLDENNELFLGFIVLVQSIATDRIRTQTNQNNKRLVIFSCII